MKAKIIEDVVTGLFDQLAHYNNDIDYGRGLYFKIMVDSESFGYEKDGVTHHESWACRKIQYCHIIIVRPSCVYMTVVDDHKDPQVSDYRNISNHDSCWRQSLNLAHIGFDCWDIAFANVPKEHWSCTKDEGLNFTLTHLLSTVYKWVDIKTEPADDGGYFKNITDIKELEVSHEFKSK